MSTALCYDLRVGILVILWQTRTPNPKILIKASHIFSSLFILTGFI